MGAAAWQVHQKAHGTIWCGGCHHQSRSTHFLRYRPRKQARCTNVRFGQGNLSHLCICFTFCIGLTVSKGKASLQTLMFFLLNQRYLPGCCCRPRHHLSNVSPTCSLSTLMAISSQARGCSSKVACCRLVHVFLFPRANSSKTRAIGRKTVVTVGLDQ